MYRIIQPLSSWGTLGGSLTSSGASNPYFLELFETARLNDVGHRRQDVANLMGKFLQEPVVLKILLSENLENIFNE